MLVAAAVDAGDPKRGCSGKAAAKMLAPEGSDAFGCTRGGAVGFGRQQLLGFLGILVEH